MKNQRRQQEESREEKRSKKGLFKRKRHPAANKENLSPNQAEGGAEGLEGSTNDPNYVQRMREQEVLAGEEGKQSVESAPPAGREQHSAAFLQEIQERRQKKEEAEGTPILIAHNTPKTNKLLQEEVKDAEKEGKSPEQLYREKFESAVEKINDKYKVDWDSQTSCTVFMSTGKNKVRQFFTASVDESGTTYQPVDKKLGTEAILDHIIESDGKAVIAVEGDSDKERLEILEKIANSTRYSTNLKIHPDSMRDYKNPKNEEKAKELMEKITMKASGKQAVDTPAARTPSPVSSNK